MIGAERCGGNCQRCDADIGTAAAPRGIRLAARTPADEERPTIARDMIERGEPLSAILAFVCEPAGGAIRMCDACCAEMVQIAVLILGEASGLRLAPRRKRKT